MPAPAEVQRRIENFDTHIDANKSGQYNETQVRVDYVNPFFTALGWDIDNTAGYAETYRDVIHEYSLKTNDGTKAPDYCFQIGGVRKFFLETKKPSVRIKDDVAPAYQVRRYGWSAGLPLSILTDFEEFAVYDCHIKPHHKDRAAVARLMYFTYKDYSDRWDELAGLFSKEAIQQGAFDKFVVSDKKKKGTSEIDKSFLADMEKWRELLAKNIALRNKNLGQKELNHYVQATIDRIVFLRICEDRNIEEYGRLQELLKKERIYNGLCRLFQQADEKYNSGLFHFQDEKGRGARDMVSLKLLIDNKPLQAIIKQLYYPESPYVFSQIPAEILGQVYEKFLGKVIRLTPAHQAKVEEKPEVRKAGGVYYTPKYIVDYIVKNTVGELLKDKTPAQAKKLRVLDPACGSGSFLLGAYQYLLGWYLQAYSKEPSKHKKLIYQDSKGEWRLATQEKKDILLANIYGVDIDRQAVEVTKLSLLLQVLDGENSDTLDSQRRLFAERALPDLRNNIKCGNSLIGTDFFHGQNLELFGRDEMEKINAFDWESEAGFGEIMRAGGFDAVIGNPPYVSSKELVYKNYFISRYQIAAKQFDLFTLFIEKSIKLTTDKGYHSFIIPDSLLGRSSFLEVRKCILERGALLQLLHTNKVFTDANVSSCVYVLQKGRLGQNNKIKHIFSESLATLMANQYKQFTYSQHSVQKIPAIKLLALSENEYVLIGKLLSLEKKLEDYCFFWRGEEIGKKSNFILKKSGSETIEILSGAKIKRYYIDGTEKHYIHQKNIEKELKLYKKDKVIVKQLGKRIDSSIDYESRINVQSVYNITSDKISLNKIVAVLNSSLVNFLYAKYFNEKQEFPRILLENIKSIPINPNISNKNDMVQLVDQMLDTQKRLRASKSESDRRHYQQKADILDKQIDALVYELYKLTAEEIKIVEGGGSGNGQASKY